MTSTNGHGLGHARRRFEAWRRGRRGRARIPEELWQAAVGVAREHGVSKAAQELHVDYYALKRRLKATPIPAPADDSVEFLEIPGKVLSAGPGCAVELQDREGRRLRVELRDVAHVESVARMLWSVVR